MNRILLFSMWLAGSLTAKAQPPLRPYDAWEATQFVALSGHQPADYVVPDNNWEILYALRSPQTATELRKAGVACTDSQLMLLEVGGLIAERDGKWKTTIPILDREQTRSLRDFGDQVAATIYTQSKPDFTALEKTISEVGFGHNAYSLLFSYLLDGKMWTQLVLFDQIENHTTWSGCYWIMYEPRNESACGTNSYGEQDLILTYLDSSAAPCTMLMDRYAAEIARQGKITDAELIAQLRPYGLTDENGIVTIPVIGNMPPNFHRLVEKLVKAISTELKVHCERLAADYCIEDEKMAMVMLYHEVMWSLMDRLVRDGVVSLPAILRRSQENKHRLHEVLFFVEGGLMQ